MDFKDIYYVDGKSQLGQAIDVSKLVVATQAEEDMVSLTEQDIRRHVDSLFVVGMWEPVQIVGYVACKKVLRPGPSALIGGLYVDPEYRGQGLATKMVRQMTAIVFSDHPYLFESVADCNPDSASGAVFKKMGYLPDGFLRNGKMRHHLSQNSWRAAMAPDKSLL